MKKLLKPRGQVSLPIYPTCSNVVKKTVPLVYSPLDKTPTPKRFHLERNLKASLQPITERNISTGVQRICANRRPFSR